MLAKLLGGDLTIPFILKVLTILMIIGSIFGYYLWDLRQSEKVDQQWIRQPRSRFSWR